MKKINLVLLILIFISTILFAKHEQQFANIGNLKLESGETLLNCKVGFRTFGKLNSDSSNVIIYPTWFGGTSGHISGLIGKVDTSLRKNSKLVDDSEYFVIAIDALANGVSTSPSNSELQRGKSFPEITITDMVNSQYKLLTNHFGFKHIFAIVGGSMGSMQALQWVVSYPDFVDKAVPYVASPRRSSYDQLIMAFRKKLINTYQELGASDSLISIMLNYSTQLFVRSPEYRIEHTSYEEFPEYLKKIESRVPSKTFTVENHLVQLQAMITHNIYRDYNNSIKETSKHIKTKLFFILGKTDNLVNPTPALKLAKVLKSDVLLLQNNCGHLSVGCELDKCSRAIYKFLKDVE